MRQIRLRPGFRPGGCWRSAVSFRDPLAGFGKKKRSGGGEEKEKGRKENGKKEKGTEERGM